MNTLLETIESWKPCGDYDCYRLFGHITPQMTIREFLYSNNIAECEKEWGFSRLLDRGWLTVDGHTVMIHTFDSVVGIEYDYETFLSMIDTFMESQEIMEEEDV